MRMAGTRSWWLLAAALAVVGLAAAAMLIWTPGVVAASLGGVLGAALIGCLSQDDPRRLRQALTRRREEHALAGTVPVSHTVRVKDQDYVALTDGDHTADVPASWHTVQLVVTGRLPVPVLLTGLHAEVLSRGGGTGELSRRAAALPVRRFEVRLDERPPRVRPVGGTDFPIRLAHHDTEVFDMAVLTDSGDVRWRLWLGWAAGDRTGNVRIDLGGQPFRTAARHGIPG
jgi:hypothetical protein